MVPRMIGCRCRRIQNRFSRLLTRAEKLLLIKGKTVLVIGRSRWAMQRLQLTGVSWTLSGLGLVIATMQST